MSGKESFSDRLSQRELRNDSGRVLRELGEGRSFVLTNRGVAVGRIVPLDAPAPALHVARPAKRVGEWAALAPGYSGNERPMQEILDELREERG